MSAPKLVVVTLPGDPLADELEEFGAKLGSSRYFTATAAEYGVGAITQVRNVRLGEELPAGGAFVNARRERDDPEHRPGRR